MLGYSSVSSLLELSFKQYMVKFYFRENKKKEGNDNLFFVSKWPITDPFTNQIWRSNFNFFLKKPVTYWNSKQSYLEY